MNVRELLDDPGPNWLNVGLALLAILIFILIVGIFVVGVVTVLGHLRWQ